MDIKSLSEEIRNCKKCSLCETRTKVVIGRGSTTPDIVFLGEAPGAEEDIQGRPFVGRSGKLLDEAIEKNNIKNFCIINILKCRTPQNRKPTPEEISICSFWLKKQITLLNPKTIVCLGATALNYFFPEKKITKSNKQCFSFEGKNLIPFFHPSFILRNIDMKPQYIKDFSILNPQEQKQEENQPEIKKKKNHTSQEISIESFPEDVSNLNSPSSSFIHLHNHSEQGSPGDVYRDLDEWASDLKEKGFNSVALTDHGSLAGLYYFQKAMQKQDIKPILGSEIYITEGKKTSHMILLVKNKIGWQNLLKIKRLSWGENKEKSHKNRNTLEHVLQNHEGLICATACVNGFLGYRVKKQLEYEPMIQRFKEVFGPDFYLEAQPSLVNEQVAINKVVIQLHKKYDIPIIITCDTHYIHKEDKEIHNVVEALKYRRDFHKDTTISDNPGFTGNTYYNMTPQELIELVDKEHNYFNPYLNQAMKNTVEITNKCNFILPTKFENTLPIINDAEEYVDKKIQENIHLVAHHDPQIIKDRLELELNRIKSKNYLPYFVIMGRLFEYAKENKIPFGPGRGSSGGSLVSYLMGITQVDPIRFNLLFERFYSEARIDPPDIDSDFSQERREELIGYLKSIYGNDNVSNVITFSTWKGKGVFRDVCRIYEVPLSKVNMVAKFIDSTKGGQDIQDAIEKNEIVREFAEKYPDVIKIASSLEGHTNFYGKHAAGVVICDKLTEKIPLEHIKDAELTSWEKDALGELGIIKLDLLGLSILDEIDRTLKNANLTWEQLPFEFEDPKVYNLLQKGITMGCHQLETEFATQYVQKVRPNNFQEIIDITSLLRPGSTKSGASEEYILRKNGKKWDYYHPLLEKITNCSLGLILTQEQVMQTFCIIGGFSQGESEKARKIIGKSKGSSALNVMREQFVKGSYKINKLSEEEANDLFDKLIAFGKYGFNNSHAVAYSLLTYWSLWLKANYPLETYTAFMDNANSEQLAIYIKEAQEMGITVKPPSIENPVVHTSFNKDKNIIYLGLNLLKQIGIEEAGVIISCGKSFARLKRKVSDGTMKILVEVGYFDSLEKNRKHLYQNLELSGNTLARFSIQNDDSEWTDSEKLTRLRKHLSWPHSNSELPETEYEDHIVTVEQYDKEKEELETPFLLKGWIYNIREFDSKDGNSKTAYLEFGDGSSSGRITLILPYSYYNQCKQLVDKIKLGEQIEPLLILVNPYFLTFKGLTKKEKKLNILRIYTIGQEIPKKALKVLNLKALDLKRNQMIVTTTIFGISKRGNAYCLISTIDNLGSQNKGLLMMNRYPTTPEVGDILSGRWNNDGFLVN